MVVSESNHLRKCQSYRQIIFDCLDGYHVSDDEIEEVVHSYFRFLYNFPQLPIYELKKALSLSINGISPGAAKRVELVIEKISQCVDTKSDDVLGEPNSFDSTVGSIGSKMDGGLIYAFDVVLEAECRQLHTHFLSNHNLPLPLENFISKYYCGYTLACCAELSGILHNYISSEEMFHNSDHDIPGLVLHGKRPELTPEELLRHARSHQNLKTKNKLVLEIINWLKDHKDLIALSDSLDSAIRRISHFLKLEYTQVTDEARLLLLASRRGPRFDQFTQELIDRMWTIIDTNTSSFSAPDGVVIGKEEKCISSFESDMKRKHASSPLFKPALDLAKYTTESLLVLTCHECSKIRKLALEILLLRLYGIRPGKVQDLEVRSIGEEWMVSNTIHGEMNAVTQSHNFLVARWTHEAIITEEWMQENVDTLEAIDNNSASSERNSPINMQYVASESKLLHMLNAFSSVSDNNGRPNQYHRTIAFLLKSPKSILEDFRRCLCELVEIESIHSENRRFVDAKILFCQIVDLSGEQKHNFTEALNMNRDLLEALEVNFVWILSVTSDTLHDNEFSQRSKIHVDTVDTDSLISCLPVTSPILKYFYFRNVKNLPKLSGIVDENQIFVEEELLRNCEPPLLPYLELRRMRNFICKKVNTSTPTVHIYEAVPRESKTENSRYFVRLIANLNESLSSDMGLYEQERTLVSGLNALELARRGKPWTTNNHMLLCVNYITAGDITSAAQQTDGAHLNSLSPNMAEQIVRDLYDKYAKRIMKLQCSTIEVRFKTRIFKSSIHSGSRSQAEQIYPYRIVLETGQTLRTRRYVEIQNPSTGDRIFAALDSGDTVSTLFLKSNSNIHEDCDVPLTPASQMMQANDYYNREEYDGKPIDTPHPWAGKLEGKRAIAQKLQTLYIYDFVGLIELAVSNMWKDSPKFLMGSNTGNHSNGSATVLLPDRLVEVAELVLTRDNELIESTRGPGLNTCGMIAWKMLLRTPEFPKGRRVIVIGNDVTYRMGTFGVQEDLLFKKASELSRELGIPRIYLAVNSGARMGLSESLLKDFRVEWMDSAKPQMGYKYIYLTEEDYEQCGGADAVVAERIQTERGEMVWKIKDVIGLEPGLGVENLCGSAAIAGETSRCYKEGLTLTYVTGRTVGIGAYLARLGHRVIQKAMGAPIILTGFQALNRLIGKHVYTSNNELGGPDIMFKNGLSHHVVDSDLAGCTAILKWLSYVPEHKNGPLPVMIDPNDPVTRPVSYLPTSLTNDPRFMLTGCISPSGDWQGGLLDCGSYTECMEGYAKSVITGRGRIGGLPLGIICVETRVTDTVIPADPAMPLAAEQTLTRAGQVWFPESAYKTAQCIFDFNKEELPLLILANWRGFSGGQRDMFHEVLKFGSMIVDALVDYKQPCIVYIPPKGELRGGAWVVVDPRISPDYMEMYAAADSRGGVLEPTGTVEIKFREKLLREAASRSDSVVSQLTEKIDSLINSGVSNTDAVIVALEEKRERRFELLMPVMRQVAVHFADLHDTPARMVKTHAISSIVPWVHARQTFYWKFRSQLIMHNLRTEVVKQDPRMTIRESQEQIQAWAAQSGCDYSSPQQFVNWTCHSVQELATKMNNVRSKYVHDQVIELCKEDLHAVTNAIRSLDKTTSDKFWKSARSSVPAGKPAYI